MICTQCLAREARPGLTRCVECEPTLRLPDPRSIVSCSKCSVSYSTELRDDQCPHERKPSIVADPQIPPTRFLTEKQLDRRATIAGMLVGAAILSDAPDDYRPIVDLACDIADRLERQTFPRTKRFRKVANPDTSQ